ncbi:MAG TPA: barstar family protein [Gemmatimonadaceae bacterium]|nr:barstar family protein [Gemmatimonadaceae bacterium]
MTATSPAPIVVLDAARITDWPSFHSVFAEVFGFPDFYGRNLDAWIDCMSYLDEPGAGMTQLHRAPAHVVTLVLQNARAFATRCPEQYRALVECIAFVNWRFAERGEPAVLALAFRD